MLITISNPILIRWAWGPRRVTSNKRYGSVASAYPSEVTASHHTWWAWIKKNTVKWLRGEVMIIIPATKAEARIKKQIEDLLPEPEALLDAVVEQLQMKRRELREARKFDEADKIRDFLEERGVTVNDTQI